METSNITTEGILAPDELIAATPLGKRPSGLYSRFGKRAFDLTVVAPLLVLLLPAFILIAVVVRVRLGKPVLFRQERPGAEGRPFGMWKFRTMLDAVDEDGRLLNDDERVTRLGGFLRSTSLDELPQLVNVLLGQMSLVGPRPLLARDLVGCSPVDLKRFQGLPGITGLAQVKGRHTLPFEDRFFLDRIYLERLSLWLDIKILASTFYVVIRRKGVLQQRGLSVLAHSVADVLDRSPEGSPPSRRVEALRAERTSSLGGGSTKAAMTIGNEAYACRPENLMQ